jgi:hypothetical protein
MHLWFLAHGRTNFQVGNLTPVLGWREPGEFGVTGIRGQGLH